MLVTPELQSKNLRNNLLLKTFICKSIVSALRLNNSDSIPRKGTIFAADGSSKGVVP